MRRSMVALVVTAWAMVLVASALVFGANRCFPRGPSYPTGEYIEPDAGRSGWELREDLRGLDIPGWVKFFKGSDGRLLWIGLTFAAVVLTGLLAQGNRSPD